MRRIKPGDIVGRISYKKDIFFIVERIIRLRNKQSIAILRGLTIRIEADSDINDLELIEDHILKNHIKNVEEKMQLRVSKLKVELRKKSIYGNVLHLDGDSRYTAKSIKYYRNLGINAIVKNVAENRQPKVVYYLLEKYKPDILVITGHDGMIKNSGNYRDIYNYRNSLYFMKSVMEARRWRRNSNELAIFARSMSKLL